MIDAPVRVLNCFFPLLLLACDDLGYQIWSFAVVVTRHSSLSTRCRDTVHLLLHNSGIAQFWFCSVSWVHHLLVDTEAQDW